MSSMNEKTQIFLIVGKKIRQTEARIVGKLAEVMTDYGIREFGSYYLDRESAEKALAGKKYTRYQQQ